jgi:hypothetical protein
MFIKYLNLAEAWNPHNVLWWLIAPFVLFNTGMVLLMALTSVHFETGVSSPDSPGARAMYYIIMGLLGLLMFLDMLAALPLVSLVSRTNGMVLREYTCPPEKAVRTAEGLFDPKAVEVNRADLSRRPSWRMFPNVFPLTWIYTEESDILVAVGQALKSQRTVVLVGPITEEVEEGAKRLQSMIDAS